MRIVAVSAFVAAGLLSVVAQAATIDALTDNFAQENHGVGILNYAGFGNFDVSRGTVDLIGSGFWDNFTNHKLYVDLAGSTYTFGAITSKDVFAPGHYHLEVDIGGPIYAGMVDGAIFSIGGNQFATGMLEGLKEYSFTYDFDLVAPAKLTIADAGATGNGNIGATLFGISLVDPPVGGILEPSTLAVMGVGLAGITLMRRRRRQVRQRAS